MHVALLVASLSLFGADFNVCNATLDQYYPNAIFANNQYYVFWADYRYSTDYALFGPVFPRPEPCSTRMGRSFSGGRPPTRLQSLTTARTSWWRAGTAAEAPVISSECVSLRIAIQ